MIYYNKDIRNKNLTAITNGSMIISFVVLLDVMIMPIQI